MSTITASQKIYPCLWFDSQGEEAAKYYVGIFGTGSRITRVTRYPDVGQETHGREAGSVMTVDFELLGVPFMALNGGPHFKFNEAISLQVMCETQDEIDRLWDKLKAGGDEKAQQCGWLKDKFGLSWQIAPRQMGEFYAGDSDEDRARAARVMAAMMKMKKLDLPALQKAAAG